MASSDSHCNSCRCRCTNDKKTASSLPETEKSSVAQEIGALLANAIGNSDEPRTRVKKITICLKYQVNVG